MSSAPNIGACTGVSQFAAACQPVTNTLAAPQPQPRPKPVPAPQPSAFLCADGASENVSYSQKGTTEIANDFVDDGSQCAQISMPSHVGKCYSNGRATLAVSGSSAQHAAGGVTRFCQGNLAMGATRFVSGPAPPQIPLSRPWRRDQLDVLISIY